MGTQLTSLLLAVSFTTFPICKYQRVFQDLLSQYQQGEPDIKPERQTELEAGTRFSCIKTVN
jgi:hypothetical protein